MKGVALGICPDATLVDISHDIPPHDVLDGAIELAAAYRYFPPGTVFLVVIDPGVGTLRRGLAVQAGGYRFVAPDNGVLSIALDAVASGIHERAPIAAGDVERVEMVEMSESRYTRPTVSRTFEGRDRFAPAAAWLASGVALSSLGRPAASLHRLHLPAPTLTDRGIDAEVLRVDRFGNLTTNIDRATWAAIGDPAGLSIRVGGRVLTKVVSTYADVQPGEICALFGSWDHLEIAANGADAAAALQVGRGTRVQIIRRELIADS